MREARVEDYFVRRVTEAGGITRKVQWIGHRGAPDRWCGWPRFGRHAMVELKRPLTPNAEAHQKREHARLRECGMRVEVCATFAEIDHFIDEMTR